LALFAALSASLVFSGAARAFSLSDHEKNIEKYVQTLNKSPEVLKTYCDMSGKPIKDVSTMGQYDIVRYVQNKNEVSVELRPAGGVIELLTENPAFKLPDGSGVGDPVGGVTKPAVVPGDYSRLADSGFVRHTWLRDGRVTVILERDAKIASIIFINSTKMKGVTINEEYAKFLGSGGKNESKAEAGRKAESPPAGSELNDSTDAKVINAYPLSSKEKNTLGIQHRAAYNLYSKKKYKDAYAAFSKLADEYDVNYLSAYWAGVTAQKLKKNDEAKTWFERALAINPNYHPAKDALAAADRAGWNFVAFESGDEDETDISLEDENSGEAIVYKEKSLKSERVGALKDGTAILVSEYNARRLTKSADPRFKKMRYEVWAKVIEPVSGWVVADEVGIWYGDVLSEYGLFKGF
jgi:hypothetical protein